MIGEGRHAATYTPTGRRADDTMRALFLRADPLRRERTPSWCIPNGSGRHRAWAATARTKTLNHQHGLMAARQMRDLLRSRR